MQVIARETAAFTPCVLHRRSLLFSNSPHSPGVKPFGAASALLSDESGLWIIPDDTAVLTHLALPSGKLTTFPLSSESAFPLPKSQKPDLEAVTWIPVDKPGEKALLVLGSGSRPSREYMAIAFIQAGRPQQISYHRAERLYRLLRATFGKQLNIEGVLWLPEEGVLRFYHRGTGDALNATCDLPWSAVERYIQTSGSVPLPTPSNLCFYDLGNIGGVPLAFTDATLHNNKVFFTAAAENTSNPYDDGTISGSAIGWMTAAGEVVYAVFRDAEGKPLPIKVEGIAPDPFHPRRFYLVTDPDDGTQPSELLWVEAGETIPGIVPV